MKLFFRSKLVESVADQAVHEWAEFIALPVGFEKQQHTPDTRDTEREFTAYPLRFVDS